MAKASSNPVVEYRWLIVCADVGSGSPGVANVVDCNAARVCDRPADRLYRLWGRTENPPGWQAVASRCFGEPPTAADTPTPQVTPGLVLTELRRVGLPPLTVRVQPEGTTLVNLPTIFYTEPVPVRTTLTLLGQEVEVEATAAEYTWHYGDGTTSVTDGPGAPYPAMEVTHTYADARVTVRPRVDVAYSARFRVVGGSWQDIAETVSMSGPATDLRVAEATALLSGDYR